MGQAVHSHPFFHHDKLAITEAFSRAAETYDRHAALQRDVGQRLLELMPSNLSGAVVLDLGCGTGYFSSRLKQRGATVVCVDISAQMLNVAKKARGTDGLIYQQGDAEQLPFAANHFDFVFSSLALQWCDDLSIPLGEMKRVLKPEGRGFFSTLVDGSLAELRYSWSKIDSYQHVNNFLTREQLSNAVIKSGCKGYVLEWPSFTVWYETAFALMRDLKGIGATHVKGRSNGLTSRKTLRQVELAYQTFKNHQGLVPATYQVCLGIIHR